MAYASLTNRILAYLIDIVIALAIYFVIAMIFGVVGAGLSAFGDTMALIGALIATVGVALGVAALFAYFIILEGRSGQTIGKRMMKIRVVNEQGGQITMGASIARNLLRIVDNIFAGLVGILVANSSDRKQRVGDKVAHTLVVQA